MKLLRILVPLYLLVVIECRREARRDRSRHAGRRAVRDEASSQVQGTCELEISCKGDNTQSAPVKLPIKGPRGPSGKTGSKGERGEPGKPGAAGLPGADKAQASLWNCADHRAFVALQCVKYQSKSAPATPKVAFFVGIGDRNLGVIEKNTDLIFDKVITNIGDGYDVETGRFTAPFNGVFHFTAVVAAVGRQKAAVYLLKDNVMVETIWAESYPYWATSTNTAILELTSGQQVWLQVLKRAPYLHGYMYSTFSGYSLFKTEEETVDDDVNEISDIIDNNIEDVDE